MDARGYRIDFHALLGSPSPDSMLPISGACAGRAVVAAGGYCVWIAADRLWLWGRRAVAVQGCGRNESVGASRGCSLVGTSKQLGRGSTPAELAQTATSSLGGFNPMDDAEGPGVAW